MSTGVPTPAAKNAATSPLRVMVVDDSAVIRGVISRLIAEDTQTSEVVALAGNGQQAVDRARKGDIDVIILDIEMPVMDGLTALPHLLSITPKPVVIMASTLTTRNADISFRAMALGAKDYVPKPTLLTPGAGLAEFKRDLLEKIRTLGNRYRRPHLVQSASTGIPGVAAKPADFTLRPKPIQRLEALAIGSSTGGPMALTKLLKALPAPSSLPIFITQHMPPTFTRMLAENITRDTGHKCAEAQHGETVAPGRVYIAPGDYHMTINREARGLTVSLDQNAKENFCRPAVDPMLRSLAPVYQRGLLVAMLTGMGQDGLLGAQDVTKAGGSVVAQDEASSVVWGMPGAVAKAGLCWAVLPLDTLGPEIAKQVGR